MSRDRIYSRIKTLFGISEGGAAEAEQKRESPDQPEKNPPPAEQAKQKTAKRRMTRGGGGLRTRLQRELDKGIALERLVPHPLGFAGASVLMGRQTRQADVDAWEAQVERLLAGRPRSLSLFRHDEAMEGFARLLVNPLESPLRDRLHRRNVQLEKIIRDL